MSANSYEHLKIPPHSTVDEQSVIGGLLIAGLAQDGSAWHKVSGLLTAEDFYRQDHRLIFSTMAALVADNKPLDVVTITTHLQERGELENAGGFAYLGRIQKDTPSAANIAAYASIVRNKSVRRGMISICTRLIESAFNADSSDDSVKSLIESGVAEMFKLELQKSAADVAMKSLKPALKHKLESIEAAIKSGKPAAEMLNGLPTGIFSVDQRWSGLEKKKLYTIAARPGMGKTVAGLQIAENVAVHVAGGGQFVAVFSLEMDIDELAERFIACSGRADYGHLRQPWTVTDEDWPRIATGVKRLGGSDILIDDSSTLSPSNVRQRVRRVMHETGKKPALIVVDYLQLMSGDGKNYGNRELEVSEISRSMKRIAKEFDCPVVQLSQLNRGVENRTNKRPILADLRESGSIEQDSNNVLFLFRESQYDADCGHDRVELISAKVRGGKTGTDIELWNGRNQRFDNMADGADYGGERW